MPEVENPSRVNSVGPSLRSVSHASVTEKVLYSFGAYATDGVDPQAGLTYFNGALYGTTYFGGACATDPQGGCGIVYSITPSGTETVLYRFQGGKYGNRPDADLIVLNGTLYGTTQVGGGPVCGGSFGCGTVFSITPSGSETILHAFGPPPDGSLPVTPLLYANGTMYGTTEEGGEGIHGGGGTAFTITPSGDEQVIHTFHGLKGGAVPVAGLTLLNGTLYGTTEKVGTVFSLTSNGREKLLHIFSGPPDGSHPIGGLVAIKHTLYGTTYEGGTANKGTVFSITPSGTEKVLYSFMGRNDCRHPEATLLNVNGTLYGTTYGQIQAYNSCLGTVFSITPSGTETVLHSFKGGQDGANPHSDLIYVNGTLYGTTENGGGCATTSGGCGTVFSIKLPRQ